MLAFYGWKGGSKAGLIQEVAIEASRAVTEIPTWMGLTARWKVRCVSPTEANDILAGCKRLEKESKAGASVLPGMTRLPAPTLCLSATAAPFQPRAALPMPRLAETASDPHEREGSGLKAGFSPSCHSTTSSIGKVPSPVQGPYPQTSDDDATSEVGLVDPSSRKKGRRS